VYIEKIDSRLNLIQKRFASPASLWLWIAAIWIRFVWNDLELKGTKVRNEIEERMIGRVLIGFGRNHRMRIEWMKHTAAMFFSLSTQKEERKREKRRMLLLLLVQLLRLWALLCGLWVWAKPYLRSMDEENCSCSRQNTPRSWLNYQHELTYVSF